jgi:hypothetical protein
MQVLLKFNLQFLTYFPGEMLVRAEFCVILDYFGRFFKKKLLQKFSGRTPANVKRDTNRKKVAFVSTGPKGYLGHKTFAPDSDLFSATCSASNQGCQIFLGATYQDGGKYQIYHRIYQMAPKYIQNCHKIDQHIPLQDPPKLTQIRIFGLKKYHLATLPPGANQHCELIS